GASVGALDQARQIGQHETATVLVLHDAEMWLQRREWIVRDLGTCAREARDERRLARVRESHQSDVGQEPQLQLDASLFALGARLRETRRLQRRGGEVHVAQAAAAALGD